MERRSQELSLCRVLLLNADYFFAFPIHHSSFRIHHLACRQPRPPAPELDDHLHETQEVIQILRLDTIRRRAVLVGAPHLGVRLGARQHNDRNGA